MTWAVKGKGLEGLKEKTEDGNPEREKEREGEGEKTEKEREFPCPCLAESRIC